MGTYVTMVVAIFLVVFTMMSLKTTEQLTPTASTAPKIASSSAAVNPAVSGFCRAPTAGEALTFQGPKDNATKCPDGPNGPYRSSNGNFRHDFSGNTTYKLVRKNVPMNVAFFTKADGQDHSDKASDLGFANGLDSSKYEVYYPQISSEIRLDSGSPFSRTRDCGERSYQFENKLYFLDYGIVFGLLLENGQPIDVGGYYLADVFQDTSREAIPPVAFDQCSPTGPEASVAPAASIAPPPMKVVLPPQQESTDNAQLQLSYFLFSQAAPPVASNAPQPNFRGWVDTCKPAIYLYPPKNQLVNVKVYPQGFLTYTDPIYDLKKGWTVNAHPDGQLTTSNLLPPTTYPYLYYESKIRDEVIQKPEKGWVIKSSDVSLQSSADTTWFNPLEEKFNTLLPELGLNQQQTKDFIDYWKKALKPAPYYFIGIVDAKNVDQFERLEITPQPDKINRVRIYFERLDELKTVEAPVVSSDKSLESRRLSSSDLTLATSHFSVVEWGGMVKNDPNHPFTCSQ